MAYSSAGAPRTMAAPGLRGRAYGMLRLTRPYSLAWFIGAPTGAMAMWVAPDAPVGRVLLLAAAFALTDGGLTTWNDLCDRETDKASSEAQRNARPIAAGTVPVGWARVQVAVLTCAGIAAGLLVEPWLGGLMLAGALYGLAYSAKPVYAGGRPLVSQLFWVALWPGLFLAVVIALDGRLSPGWVYVCGVVAFMAVGETLAKDLRDLDNDAATGKRTTPVVYGPRKTSVVAATAMTVGGLLWIVAVLLADPLPGRLAAALAVVLALWTGRAWRLALSLRADWTKDAARDLHVGSIRVFLTVNLLLVAGLPT